MATKRDVRNAVADLLLTGPGLDATEKAIQTLLFDAMQASDLPRAFALGRLGGEVLKLKGEVGS